jgi:hypothetical protein
MKLTRRNFLSSIGAVGAATMPIAGFPAILKRRNPNAMLSHAAIGCAHQAAFDLASFASHPDLNVTAVCDVDSSYLAVARKRYPRARFYRDAFEMFAAEGNKIDSVNVSTPDHTHAQYVVEALNRGLNVYAQKPLCHDLGDCRRIEKLASEKKAVTQLGTQIAAWECDRRTVAAINSGVIGNIKHVWLFSTRRAEPKSEYFRWPLPEAPVPKTLDWKLWLGPVKYRPYFPKVYHPGQWRKWRDFGTSWLGDLGLHLMCPIWLGMRLGGISPLDVVADISNDDWTAAQREQFWPSMSHVTWTFPGVKASGMKPFTVEWCDGFGNVSFRLEPKFMPPQFLQDIAALTPMKRLPQQGRVIEGERGWLLSTHYDAEPYFVMKDGSRPPAMPTVGAAPSHYHEYVNVCLQGGRTRTPFSMAGRLTEWGFVGNLAQLQPGKKLECAKLLKGNAV